MSELPSTGIFLTIEGIEGVGKSTAVRYIQTYLTSLNQACVLTREPGGTPIAEEIRRILLSPNAKENLTAESELLLMFASRSQHIAEVILPALTSGKWVISDRFVDASFAYQGRGRFLSESKISVLNDWVVNGLIPNKTILLDAPPEIGLARAKQRGEHDRIELEKIDFFDRVREGYLHRAKCEPERFSIIDATQPLETVQPIIRQIIDQLRATT